MNLKRRVSRLEDGLAPMDPGQTSVVIIYGRTEAGYRAGIERYERSNPLELSDRPGDDKIIIHFRRPDPNQRDEKD